MTTQGHEHSGGDLHWLSDRATLQEDDPYGRVDLLHARLARWVNLRKEVAARRQSGDPPQLGDTYSDTYVVEADGDGAPEPASPLPGSGA